MQTQIIQNGINLEQKIREVMSDFLDITSVKIESSKEFDEILKVRVKVLCDLKFELNQETYGVFNNQSQRVLDSFPGLDLEIDYHYNWRWEAANECL